MINTYLWVQTHAITVIDKCWVIDDLHLDDLFITAEAILQRYAIFKNMEFFVSIIFHCGGYRLTL